MIADIELGLLRFGANYRTEFDEGELGDLVASMKAQGQLAPVIARPNADGSYQLLAGERRARAAEILKWTTLKADVRTLSDDEALSVTLTENMCRVNTNPIEDARGFERARSLGWDMARIASAAGVRPSSVSNRLALLDLRPDLQALVASGDLTVGYAACLVAVHLDHNRQLMAMAKLRENPAPTLSWFKAVCSELGEAQAQSGFGIWFDSIACAADLGKISLRQEILPPTPSASSLEDLPKPPMPRNARGIPKRQALTFYVSFWQAAATSWSQLGHKDKAAECLGAVKALELALLWA